MESSHQNNLIVFWEMLIFYKNVIYQHCIETVEF